MKKNILLIAIIFSAAGALQAQKYTSVTYSIGFPSGDLLDYIGKTSWRGINIDYKNLINPNVGIGFSVGWNVFYEELAKDTYTLDNISVTGKQYRYSNHVPIFVNANYYLKPEEDKCPFFGFGIGTIYTARNTDMNLYTYKLEAWNFAIQPEIGMKYEMNPDMALSISGRYTHGFQAGEIDTPQSYFSLNIGFIFIK